MEIVFIIMCPQTQWSDVSVFIMQPNKYGDGDFFCTRVSYTAVVVSCLLVGCWNSLKTADIQCSVFKVFKKRLGFGQSARKPLDNVREPDFFCLSHKMKSLEPHLPLSAHRSVPGGGCFNERWR